MCKDESLDKQKHFFGAFFFKNNYPVKDLVLRGSHGASEKYEASNIIGIIHSENTARDLKPDPHRFFGFRSKERRTNQP